MPPEISIAEFVTTYGDVEVTFSSYYKYTFTFTGKVGENTLVCTCGGDSDVIYRFEVTDRPITIEALHRESSLTYGYILNPKGGEIVVCQGEW